MYVQFESAFFNYRVNHDPHENEEERMAIPSHFGVSEYFGIAETICNTCTYLHKMLLLPARETQSAIISECMYVKWENGSL